MANIDDIIAGLEDLIDKESIESYRQLCKAVQGRPALVKVVRENAGHFSAYINDGAPKEESVENLFDKLEAAAEATSVEPVEEHTPLVEKRERQVLNYEMNTPSIPPVIEENVRSDEEQEKFVEDILANKHRSIKPVEAGFDTKVAATEDTVKEESKDNKNESKDVAEDTQVDSDEKQVESKSESTSGETEDDSAQIEERRKAMMDNPKEAIDDLMASAKDTVKRIQEEEARGAAIVEEMNADPKKIPHLSTLTQIGDEPIYRTNDGVGDPPIDEEFLKSHMKAVDAEGLKKLKELGYEVKEKEDTSESSKAKEVEADSQGGAESDGTKDEAAGESDDHQGESNSDDEPVI